MLSTDLQRQLVNHIIKNSGHEDHRAFIGLSQISRCEQVLYDRFIHGESAGVSEKMKSALAHDLQEVLVVKLTVLRMFAPGRIIELHGGLVQGHPDGEVCGDLLEIKTVEREDWLPGIGRLPTGVYWQVQAYLHYAGYRFGHVVYIARDTGSIKVIGVRKNPDVCRQIDIKVTRLVAAVKSLQRPDCTCGRCEP